MSIEAMKQAREALALLDYLWYQSANMNPQVVERKMYAAMSTLGTAIEQAEKQEPVAWMYVNTDGECEQIEYGLCDFDDPSIQLLYTAPRQWVGLTNEEIEAVMQGPVEGERMLPYQFARAIEAKLKAKNEHLP